MKEVIVTTSWDDGAVEDIKLLNLLNEYGLKGTFYIPESIDYEIEDGKKVVRMPDDDVKRIAESQEVGAHSLSHIYFDKLNREDVKAEISGSKGYLEDLLGKEVKMFCYPGGVFTENDAYEVKSAGFLGARTVDLFKFEVNDFFQMPTSINCYPFPFRYDSLRAFFQPVLKYKEEIFKLKLSIKSFLSWQNLAMAMFDHAVSNGGMFHLWGHSWEIEKNNMWQDLEEVFKYISNKEGVKYMTNSETLEFLKQGK
ncbi:MAG: polysaccharide deacetylase family protein [Parcubacteria group bacterium]|nr:polysaccharide deacetylase family protein [Parcubacteria group bacterium]MCR4342530.1 polysaccharide deacetylase family protein [Patescibacteria group bacterium]